MCNTHSEEKTIYWEKERIYRFLLLDEIFLQMHKKTMSAK